MGIPSVRFTTAMLSAAAALVVLPSPLPAQSYDEGVAPTRAGPDAESGQFEAPRVDPAESRYERPDASNPATPSVWNPRPSGQFVGDLCSDKARGMAMDTVAELPGGGIVKFADDFVIGPATAAAQAQGSDGDEPLPGERVAAAVLALAQAGAQVVFPEIGLVVQGGQVMINGTSYMIDSMASAAREQQTMAMLTGYGGALGGVGNLGASTPFIAFLQRQQRYRGLNAENLGEYIHSPQELTAAVGQWEAHLRDVFMETNRRPDNQRIISEMLVPRLYNMWLAQRVEHIIHQANGKLTARNRAALSQTQAQDNCRPPQQAAANPWRGLYSGIVDTPVSFEWDTRIRVHGIVCFGGTKSALYFDHYHLNGRFVGADQREYYRVRNPAAANGQFCGEWETRREEMRK